MTVFLLMFTPQKKFKNLFGRTTLYAGNLCNQNMFVTNETKNPLTDAKERAANYDNPKYRVSISLLCKLYRSSGLFLIKNVPHNAIF